MAALHNRSFDVGERIDVLARNGHTPESAFRGMYDELDLDAWFASTGVSASTRHAIRTWRGSVALPGRPTTS